MEGGWCLTREGSCAGRMTPPTSKRAGGQCHEQPPPRQCGLAGEAGEGALCLWVGRGSGEGQRLPPQMGVRVQASHSWPLEGTGRAGTLPWGGCPESADWHSAAGHRALLCQALCPTTSTHTSCPTAPGAAGRRKAMSPLGRGGTSPWKQRATAVQIRLVVGQSWPARVSWFRPPQPAPGSVGVTRVGGTQAQMVV